MTGWRLILLFVIFSSCTDKEKVTQKKYVDLKGFFATEINRLEKIKSKVNKTVSRNGVSESKENVYPNWRTELNLFSESDINKPAWSNSYKVNTTHQSVLYTATDSKLKTRSIFIKKNKNGSIALLSIINSAKNHLYSSSEELLYIPDSVYQIVKKQDVLLLGNNSYRISGFFR